MLLKILWWPLEAEQNKDLDSHEEPWKAVKQSLGKQK